MKRKWFRILLQRRLLVIILLLAQIAFFLFSVIYWSNLYSVISTVLSSFSLIVCLYILTDRTKPEYKLTWIFTILLFPLFGGLFYLIFRTQSSTRRFYEYQVKLRQESKPMFLMPGRVKGEAVGKDPENALLIKYLEDTVAFPVYSNTTSRFLPSGEAKFACLVEELKKAKKYIFLEYFIVQEGVMWDSILDILKQKAAEGVEVRFMYDDVGCMLLLPKDYPKMLADFGIKCAVFNPFLPILSTMQNNRDHRKIVSIDGKVAFTGGCNLADEYINAYEKYGHWKDSSVKLEGNAAWSLTLMFLEMWSLAARTEEDFTVYYPWKDQPCPVVSDGFVQPYCDSPIDTEEVGEQVYLHLINRAKKYLYICTPYLIVDESILSAISLAAKSGVDVRIMTPHHPDKLLVHMTTRSYYGALIDAGVRVFEYTPGFVHSKIFVSDDEIATVGTTNLDYRSLYLNFECGTVLYGCSAIKDIRTDFIDTLSSCQEFTAEKCRRGFFARLFQSILRLFAPLM